MSDVVRKIQALLRLAASTTSKHEAEAAAAKAQEIMDQHGIEEGRVADSDDGLETSGVGNFKRVPFEVDAVASILQKHFRVRCVAFPNGTGSRRRREVRVCGRRHHVEIAVHVFTFLLGAFRRCWDHDRKLYGLQASDRRVYMLCMRDGIESNLAMDAERADRSAKAIVPVDRWIERAFPDFTSRRRPSPLTCSGPEAMAAGEAAGLSTCVRPAMRGSGTREERPLLGATG